MVRMTYRLLLLLLPRRRRVMHGAEMQDVFAKAMHASSARGGRWSAVRLWIREVIGMTGFALRERFGRLRPSGFNELRWAWRGVRARGWRAAFIIGLFGVALAANAVVFAAADTFVFRTVPYDRPDQLVIFGGEALMGGASDYTNRDPLLEWRKHTDLFAGIQAHDRAASVYVTHGGITEIARAHQVTPGMFELLGVMPAHGRPFVSADAEPGAPPTAVISHALARQVFQDAPRAVGRTLDAAPDTPLVIGVMPPQFRFPTAVEQIWRPMKLQLIPHNVGVRAVGRLQPDRSIDNAARAYQDRLPAVVAAVPEESRGTITRRLKAGGLSLQNLAEFQRHEGVSTIFAMLLGAAGCLLLIACANVASLEMAASVARTRTLAVQTALGASRGSLVRATLIEGALLLAASAIVAVALAVWGLDVLSAQLTVAMRDALANPLDLDPRVIGFMAVVAAFTWGLTTLPSVVQLSRLSVVAGLRHDPRTMPVSRGAARSRQWLMTAQVALTVVLLVGALLYIRAYEHRIGLDKGLDTRGLATIVVGQAPDVARDEKQLGMEILERLRALPGVRAAARVSLLPPSTQAGAMGPMRIAGRDGDQGVPMVSLNSVDPDYFDTMSIVAVEGRLFDTTTRQDQIVIDERFAKRYWPDESPIGARFRIGSTGMAGVREYEVIGVSRSMRADRVATEGGNDVFFGYFRMTPTSNPLNFVVRMDDERGVGMLTDAVRSIGPRLLVRADTVEARYRRLEADNRLAAAITSGFGTLAWFVAAAGIYAVMAFLVAGRTREIGIRMALGADDRSVRRMVLGTSLKPVLTGAAVGLTASALAFQSIASQLFGVTPTDPQTYASVTGLVLVTALLATWFPARRAARVDPAITLRAE
jgi:putative ABC transport system permease protein